MIRHIAVAIDAIKRDGRQPVRIEIGERQARAIANELNEGWYLQELLGLLENTALKPIHWEQIVQGDARLFGIRIQRVESPDYLNVVAGETA